MIPTLPYTHTGQPFPPNPPPGYIFDQTAGVYRDRFTGKAIPPEKILQILDQNEALAQSTMTGISAALLQRDEPAGSWREWLLAAWLLSMQMTLRRLHVQNAALGAGGFSRLRPEDWVRIRRLVNDDIDRLVRFGNEIAAGNLSERQIANRVNLYVGTARSQFWFAQAVPRLQPGETIIERRIPDPEADHCEFCPYLVGLGWQPYGFLPPPGVCVENYDGSCCGGNCRCSMRRIIIRRDEIDQWVTTPIPARYRGGI